MCVTEYDHARALAEQRQDGFEISRAKGKAEGRAEGKEEATLSLLMKLVGNGTFPYPKRQTWRKCRSLNSKQKQD